MTHKQISGHISDNIPPQMKILNSNALLKFCLKSEHCKRHKATWHPTKCDIINDVKLFQQYGISQNILLLVFDVIQSNITFQIQVH